MINIGTAYIVEISSPTAGDRATRARVVATYEMGNTLGSITFDVTIEEAQNLHIGQKLALNIQVEAP